MADQAATPQPGGAPSVVNPTAGWLNSAAMRSIDTAIFSGTSGRQGIKLPTDTVIKRMYCELFLIATVTYPSGSPLTTWSVFGSMVPNVEFNIGGNRVIKSVNPNIMRMHNILLNADLPRRSWGDTAGAPTSSRAPLEWMAGQIAYPATTHYIQFNEHFEMNFENPWGYGGSRYLTETDIRNVSSANLIFNWQPVSSIQDPGSTGTVAYTNVSAQIVTRMYENRARPPLKAGDPIFDYVETSNSPGFTGPGNNQQLPDLQDGLYLMGVGLYVQNGDTHLTPSENLLKNISLKVNSASALQGPASQLGMQDDNLARYGGDSKMGNSQISATAATVVQSGLQALSGFSFMNLLRNGDWGTALNTSKASGVSSLRLQFDTPATTGVDAGTYTNPLTVTYHTHEIKILTQTS